MAPSLFLILRVHLPKMYPVIGPSVCVIFHVEVWVGLQVTYAEPLQSYSLDGGIRRAGANSTWHGALARFSCQVKTGIPATGRLYGSMHFSFQLCHLTYLAPPLAKRHTGCSVDSSRSGPGQTLMLKFKTFPSLSSTNSPLPLSTILVQK